MRDESAMRRITQLEERLYQTRLSMAVMIVAGLIFTVGQWVPNTAFFILSMATAVPIPRILPPANDSNWNILVWIVSIGVLLMLGRHSSVEAGTKT